MIIVSLPEVYSMNLEVSMEDMSSNHSILPPNDIFSLSAEGYCLSSAFCTHMMLCHVFNEVTPNPVQEGNLEMSLHLWHEKVLRPTVKHITERHQIPTFAQKAMEILSLYEGPGNRAILLHISLLHHASKEILEQCNKGNFGKKTLQEVKYWFQIMESTMNIPNFSKVPECFREAFEQTVHAHLPGIRQCDGKQEHPYFSHETLFLHISHMVFFYCKNNITNDFPNINIGVTIEVEDEEMFEWERLSGDMFVEIFDLKDGYTNTNGFAIFELPYEELAQTILAGESPSVGKLHVDVQLAIHKYVEENLKTSCPLDWVNEIESLTDFMAHAKHLFDEKYKALFNNRKKQRTHYMKKRNQSVTYKSKQKYSFMRYVFLMGGKSTFFEAKHVRAKQKKEFQFDLSFLRQEDASAHI